MNQYLRGNKKNLPLDYMITLLEMDPMKPHGSNESTDRGVHDRLWIVKSIFI